MAPTRSRGRSSRSTAAGRPTEWPPGNGLSQRNRCASARASARSGRPRPAGRRRPGRVPGRGLRGPRRGRGAARLDHRNVDWSDQRRRDRRQREARHGSRSSRSCADRPVALDLERSPGRQRHAHGELCDADARRPGVLCPQSGGLVGTVSRCGCRAGRLLSDRTLAQNTRGTDRHGSAALEHSAADRWSGQRTHRSDALLRLSGRTTRAAPCHGLGCAATRVPCRARGRRVLLGRRTVFEHSDRGRARRSAAPQFGRVCRSALESAGRSTSVDLGRHGSTPRKSSTRAGRAATLHASSRYIACATSLENW